MRSPTSFRLRPETLRQLDRIAELLGDRRRRAQLREPGLSPAGSGVTRSEALAVAVREVHDRLERELEVEPGSGPHRAVADAARGMLPISAGISLVDELARERREEAAAES